MPLRKLFYPIEAPVPSGIETANYTLRPLLTADVALDFAAVMENPAALRHSAGGQWPADNFTIEENRADLEMHEREHQERIAFTYTVMDPEGSTCLGCVYLNPLERLLRKGTFPEPATLDQLDDYEAVVRFWVRASLIPADLDRELFQALQAWLAEAWPFRRVAFRAAERDRRQSKLFQEAGMKVWTNVRIKGSGRAFDLYRRA